MYAQKSSQVYKRPDNYKPPEENDLADNVDYPNLNSRDYAHRPLNHALRMHEAWECVAINTPNTSITGNIAVCCNKLSGRDWTSSLWGFEKEYVAKSKTLDPNEACFKLQCNAIINRLAFVQPNIVLLAFSTGKLQAWSTYSEVRNAKNPYCLFMIGEKYEHMKPIVSLATYSSNNTHKAITGCKDGTLKIWDMGGADLYSQNSYRFAHMDAITGIASSRLCDSTFATCSLDKSCLLWDSRETLPAIALYENHSVRFKHTCWAEDPADNLLYLGDESGNVLTVDKRTPKQLLNQSKYFDRPIRRIQPNKDNLAVIADSNIVKISKSSSHSTIYENAESQNFIRDFAWLSFSSLLTVGLEGKLRYHNLQ